MRALFLILAVLIAFVSLAIVVNKYPGYVLIDVHGWVMESTLVFFVLALLAFFALLHYTLRMWGGLKQMPINLGNWKSKRAKDKVDNSLITGLLYLVECNWSSAEQQLLRFAELSKAPLLNYLGAARAAQELGEFERRDNYLRLAHQIRPQAEVPVGLTQAELQLSQNQQEQALATYSRLHQLEPKNKKVLSGLIDLYQKLSDWDNVLQISAEVRKNKAMPIKAIEVIERQAYLQLLISAGKSKNIRVEDTWYRVAAHLQVDQDILVVYVDQLLQQNSSELAEPLIRNSLKRNWNPTLIRQYGILNAADPFAQLQFAEGMLAQRENDAGLLLTLARLCMTNELWGKARTYLEASIGASPQPEAYAELGQLLESMGEKDAAVENYRAGLRLVPGCDVTSPSAKQSKEIEKLGKKTDSNDGNNSGNSLTQNPSNNVTNILTKST